MRLHLTLATATLLSLPLLPLDSALVTAEPEIAAPAVAIERFCDYCRDYTDAAVAASPVTSAYRPGLGYAATLTQGPEPLTLAATGKPGSKEE